MELKLGRFAMIMRKIHCSNRTFMELKSMIRICKIESILVLIVPLWN